LEFAKMGMDDMELWEMNEAFAAQVIACNRVKSGCKQDQCSGFRSFPGASSRYDRSPVDHNPDERDEKEQKTIWMRDIMCWWRTGHGNHYRGIIKN